MEARKLWKCPKCGRKFVNGSMPHSCGAYSVKAFLAGKDRVTVGLYQRFLSLARECGPFKIAPAKTRIGFQAMMIFAAVNKLGDRGLDGHLILNRRLDSPFFRRIKSLSPHCHVHHFRVTSVSEMEDEFKSWLQEAYRVGTQERLLKF